MEHDVIVIGAGPGGSATAKAAAEKGLDVLLVEKRNEIGAPKRCGEGLSASGMKRAGLKPDPAWAIQFIEGAYLFSPNEKRVEIHYGNGGYTIERKIFDKYLAYEAADAGAKVMSGARCTGLLDEGGRISGVTIKDSTSTKDFKARVVVAADGVESKLARWAGIDSTLQLIDACKCTQFEMGNLNLEDPQMLELYMGEEVAPGGYVWVFPKGEKKANVGIGVRANRPGLVIDYLKRFVESHDHLSRGSIIEINGGNVPVSKPLKQLVLDNFMIVGDAAHQVNAIHGGGIIEAITSGRLAGTSAAEAINENDTSLLSLKRYEKDWSSTEGKRLSKLVTLRQVIEKLTDAELNYLAGELSGDDIIELTRAERFTKLSKIFAKNPKLLRLVPKLLKS